MATNITNAFIDLWNTEVKHAYQQKKSKLRDAVRSVSGVRGATHKFHTLGTVTANTKARDADITPLNPSQGVATATLEDSYAGIYIDKLDQVKTNAQFRKEYVMASASALGRKNDDHVIGAMDASNSQIATTTGGLTYAKLLEALEALNAADVDPEDRYLVVGAKQLTDALGISQLTSADYMTIRSVVNGDVQFALGFKWIMSTRLTLTLGSPANQRQCYAFNKQAIGLAIGQDVNTEINYIPEKVSWLVNSYMSMGAVVIEPTGVINIKADE